MSQYDIKPWWMVRRFVIVLLKGYMQNFLGCYITELNCKNLVIYAQLDTMICLKSRLKLCSNIVFVFSVSVNDSTQGLRS